MNSYTRQHANKRWSMYVRSLSLVCPYAKTSLVIQNEIANFDRGCGTKDGGPERDRKQKLIGDRNVAFLEGLLRRYTERKTHKWSQ